MIPVDGGVMQRFGDDNARIIVDQLGDHGVVAKVSQGVSSSSKLGLHIFILLLSLSQSWKMQRELVNGFRVVDKDFILKADNSISHDTKTADYKASQKMTVDGGQALVLTSKMTKIN